MKTAHLVWTASLFSESTPRSGPIVALNPRAAHTLRELGYAVTESSRIFAAGWQDTNLELAASLPAGNDIWTNFVVSELNGAYYLWLSFREIANRIEASLFRLYVDLGEPLRGDLVLACSEALRPRGITLEVLE